MCATAHSGLHKCDPKCEPIPAVLKLMWAPYYTMCVILLILVWASLSHTRHTCSHYVWRFYHINNACTIFWHLDIVNLHIHLQILYCMVRSCHLLNFHIIHIFHIFSNLVSIHFEIHFWVHSTNEKKCDGYYSYIKAMYGWFINHGYDAVHEPRDNSYGHADTNCNSRYATSTSTANNMRRNRLCLICRFAVFVNIAFESESFIKELSVVRISSGSIFDLCAWNIIN